MSGNQIQRRSGTFINRLSLILHPAYDMFKDDEADSNEDFPLSTRSAIADFHSFSVDRTKDVLTTVAVQSSAASDSHDSKTGDSTLTTVSSMESKLVGATADQEYYGKRRWVEAAATERVHYGTGSRQEAYSVDKEARYLNVEQAHIDVKQQSNSNEMIVSNDKDGRGAQNKDVIDYLDVRDTSTQIDANTVPRSDQLAHDTSRIMDSEEDARKRSHDHSEHDADLCDESLYDTIKSYIDDENEYSEVYFEGGARDEDEVLDALDHVTPVDSENDEDNDNEDNISEIDGRNQAECASTQAQVQDAGESRTGDMEMMSMESKWKKHGKHRHHGKHRRTARFLRKMFKRKKQINKWRQELQVKYGFVNPAFHGFTLNQQVKDASADKPIRVITFTDTGLICMLARQATYQSCEHNVDHTSVDGSPRSTLRQAAAYRREHKPTGTSRVHFTSDRHASMGISNASFEDDDISQSRRQHKLAVQHRHGRKRPHSLPVIISPASIESCAVKTRSLTHLDCECTWLRKYEKTQRSRSLPDVNVRSPRKVIRSKSVPNIHEDLLRKKKTTVLIPIERVQRLMHLAKRNILNMVVLILHVEN